MRAAGMTRHPILAMRLWPDWPRKLIEGIAGRVTSQCDAQPFNVLRSVIPAPVGPLSLRGLTVWSGLTVRSLAFLLRERRLCTMWIDLAARAVRLATRVMALGIILAALSSPAWP